MTKYVYTGLNETHLIGVGVVQPGDVVEAENINHPLFEEMKKSKSAEKREAVQNEAEKTEEQSV